MTRGRRTSYTRDNSGRFASSPGGGAPKRSTPATRRAAMRAGNRLSRDNSGRITGIGRNGATVRGGRLKTAKGNRRATQLASTKVAGFRGGTIAKGGRGIRGSVARSLAAARKERMAGGRPAAAKQQPQGPSKKPANKAQQAYLSARRSARSRNRDLRGADAGSRRMASSAAALVRNMERRRSAAVPKAPADSPRARQQQRQLARSQRANRNSRAAWAREADGPGSKASRSATVARRAQQIYAGEVDPKAKTKSRLTKTRDPEVLRKRIAKIKDNTARAAAKAAAKAAKASAKPARSARARRSTVVPALQGSDKLAPLSPQRRKVLERASARQTVLVNMTNDARDKLEKARNKAIPANNPYSSMTPQARKAALTRLQTAEKTYEKLRKSSLTVQGAKMFATGFAGATKQGYTRYDNAARRSDIRTPRAKPKPTAPNRTRASRPAGTVAKPRGMKRDPEAMSTLKSNQKRRARMAQNMRDSSNGSNRIFGYTWGQIQAAQRGNSGALRYNVPY